MVTGKIEPCITHYFERIAFNSALERVNRGRVSLGTFSHSGIFRKVVYVIPGILPFLEQNEQNEQNEKVVNLAGSRRY